MDHDILVFHGGTRAVENPGQTRFLTNGGRVLTVAGCGPTLAEARDRVYENLKKISFKGAHYRTDVAVTRNAATVGRASSG